MRFILLLVVSSFCFPMDVVSHWLETPAKKRDGEITQERSRPIPVGDILYSANLSGEVVAMHRTEGYPLWRRQVEAGVEGALAYGRSKIIVGDLKGNLYGLNARDGSESWRFKINSEWIATPFIFRDRVVAGASSEEIFVLTETDGKEVWHYSHRGDEKMTVRGMSGPIVYGSDVFVGFADGSVVSLSADKGRVNWVKRLRTRERFYDVDMNVHADDQGIIAGVFDGKVYALDRTTGSTQWVYPVGSYGGFLVDAGKVYFCGLDGNVYALDRGTGVQVWKTPILGGVGLTPARVGEFLVVTTAEDPFYVVDPKDGKIVWREKLGAGTLAAPSGTMDGWFYVLSNYGNLFSYELRPQAIRRLSAEVVPSHTAVIRNLADKRYN